MFSLDCVILAGCPCPLREWIVRTCVVSVVLYNVHLWGGGEFGVCVGVCVCVCVRV